MSFHSQVRDRLYGLQRSTSFYAPQLCDPILTPFFSGLFASLGATGSLFGFGLANTLGALTTAVVTTAVSIGIQSLFAPKPPTPEEAKNPLTQPIPPRHWVVGRTRMAGAMMLWESKARWLCYVQAIAGHRINSFNRFWLHDDEVTVTGGFVQDPGDGRYRNNVVQIGTRVGVSTSSAFDFISEVLEPDGLYGPTYRGDGQAAVGMKCYAVSAQAQMERFPYGPPRLSVEVDGARCWDPRDPAQSPTNPFTWTWTRNSALIMLWHQCFNEFGHRRDYRKAILPVLDQWKQEADICDEDVPLAGGGTQKRYWCSGSDTGDHDPKVGTNSILSTCDGWLCERGDGALIFLVGKFREALVTTLTDHDIVGYQLQHDVLPEDECNLLVPKFTYPANDYATSDTDFFEDVPAQLIAGRPLREEADYSWCHQWQQARRLGKRDWLRLQEKKKGSIDVRLSGVNSVYSRWVRLSTPLGAPSLDGMLVENRRAIIAITKGGFTMDFVKCPENIDAWNPAVDEGAQPPVPPKPNAADIITPDVVSIVPTVRGQGVFLRSTVVASDDDSQTLVMRYRLTDDGGLPGDWVPEQRFTSDDFTVSGGNVIVSSSQVPGDTTLDVQFAWMSARGRYSNWSATTTVTTLIDTTAPAALSSFTQTAPAPHLGNAAFSIVTPNDSHVKTVKLYRKASGAALNVASDTPIAILSVGASSSYGYTDGDATRTNLLSNPNFDTDTVWTKGTGWTIAAGLASKAAGVAANLSQSVAFTAGAAYRLGYTLSGVTGGLERPRFSGGTTVNGPLRSTSGTFLDTMSALSGNNLFSFVADGSFVGNVDGAVLYQSSAGCAPQGVWDYYAVPFNGSGLPGPATAPLTVTIV